MEIYTSYFGNLKKIPDSIIPISIAGKSPDWYGGLEYKKLAPLLWFFQEWKENKDNNFYIGCYNEYVLRPLFAPFVKEKLALLSYYKDVALLCYEKPEDFCHRHLVAKWFKESGIEVKEFPNG